jgi:glycosyltransferase involved in cell wall biosynthesis
LQSWSIIIFGFNEEGTVCNVVDSSLKFCTDNNIEEYEVIVIDDGSTDNTAMLLSNNFSQNSSVKLIRHGSNLGIGPAMNAGYNSAQMENLIGIPADGQFDINELKPHINFPGKTFLSFYREQSTGYNTYRNLVTSLNKSLNRNIFKVDIRDINWVKAYKTADLKKIDLRINSSLINTEIISKFLILGYKSIEIPSVYHRRVSGVARGASLKTMMQAGKELIKLSFIISKFRKNYKK